MTLAFGPCCTPADLPGPSHCPALQRRKKVTARAEGKAMPERQVLELERALRSPERSDLATVTQAARKGPGWPGFAS